MMKLPRGRSPVNPAAMPAYIAKVAKLNGTSVVKAEEFIRGRVGGLGITVKTPTTDDTSKTLVIVHKSDAEIIAEIKSRFNILNDLASEAAKGKGRPRALGVSGAGGVGKTHTITSKLEHGKEQGTCKYDVTTGGQITGINLYMLLYKNREPNAVTVLDDSDGVFSDESALLLLKAATDTTKRRKLSWLSESPALKAEDIPKEFYYEGVIIFLTNLDFSKIVEEGKSRLVPHVQALMTRSMYLDLGLHTTREVMLWINHMVRTHHILVQEGLTHEQEEEVLVFMQEHRERVRFLSIRTAIKMAQLLQMYGSKWKEYAINLECRKAPGTA